MTESMRFGWNVGGKVKDCTRDDEHVPPVYLMDEIVKLAQAASRDELTQIVDIIVRRLREKSVYVKKKTLTLIKYVCAKDLPGIKKGLQSHHKELRAMQEFKGISDPLKGDAPNQAVRDAAKLAIASLYDSGGTMDTSNVGFVNTEGFGSDSVPRSTPVPKAVSPAGKKMQGFGPDRKSLELKRDDMHTVTATASGGFKPVMASTKPSSYVISTTKSGEDEKSLVDQICFAGGLRAQPSEEDLGIFVDSAGTMNGTSLAKALQVHLEGHSWQAQLRAVYVINAVLTKGESAACGEIAVHFQKHPSSLKVIVTSSAQAMLREKAAALYTLLVGEEPTEAAPAGPAPKAASAQDTLVGNLLGDPLDSAPVGTATDLFSGLELTGGAAPAASAPAAAAAPAPQGDLFGGLSFSPDPVEWAEQTPQPSSSGLGDMFSGSPAAAVTDTGNSSNGALAVATTAPAPALDASLFSEPGGAGLMGAASGEVLTSTAPDPAVQPSMTMPSAMPNQHMQQAQMMGMGMPNQQMPTQVQQAQMMGMGMPQQMQPGMMGMGMPQQMQQAQMMGMGMHDRSRPGMMEWQMQQAQMMGMGMPQQMQPGMRGGVQAQPLDGNTPDCAEELIARYRYEKVRTQAHLAKSQASHTSHPSTKPRRGRSGLMDGPPMNGDISGTARAC
ncbi:hypothetical protein CYMTET_38006 [Cymbomonas tetramitiformis]|uniref:ENTH domain-containing protein n=1 Tax=Cymbomonas tetramitiformis TaxID=36881 RepID=A0AAE0F5W4_9CHLO|nr:hypothetical protein CYMTET_38006 [Cymbomonas tetramitiformis]